MGKGYLPSIAVKNEKPIALGAPSGTRTDIKHKNFISAQNNPTSTSNFHKKKKILFHEQESENLKLVNKVKKLEDTGAIDEYTKNTSNRIEKIKKRTMMIVQIDKYQVKTAIEALKYKHQKSVEEEISLKYDDFIYLDILLTQQLPNVTIKPILIPLKHKIFERSMKSSISLLVRDSTKLKTKQKEILAKAQIDQIDLQHFKDKFLNEKKVKEFLRRYPMCLVEDKIFEFIRKRCYKDFLNKKTMPYPVNIPKQVEDWEGLTSTLSSVILVKTKGPMHSIKLGRCEDISVKDNVKNIINGIYEVMPHLLLDSDKGTNVREIKQRTKDSISINIFKNDLSVL